MDYFNGELIIGITKYFCKLMIYYFCGQINVISLEISFDIFFQSEPKIICENESLVFLISK